MDLQLQSDVTLTSNQWSLRPGAAEFYERYRVPALFAPMAEMFLARVALASGMRVLDVACGTGAVTRLAARQVAPLGRVSALDQDVEMLAVAAGAVADAPVPINWVLGDAEAFPFEDECFDVVLCQQGLQFFGDATAALREMRRVCAPGGQIACVNFGALSRYGAALAAALRRRAEPDGDKWQPKNRMPRDPAGVLALAASAGLENPSVVSEVLNRTVIPTQEWLLNDTVGSPNGAAIHAMEPFTRAELVREVADDLRDLWVGDAYSVPVEVLILTAQRL